MLTRNPDSLDSCLDKIVLKFTTLSEAGTDAPSFTIDSRGASIGREPSNEVNVPSDVKLAPQDHARIDFLDGAFYLVDGGCNFGAGVRISVGPHKKSWILESGSHFSAGTSVFRSNGLDADGNLILDITEGPLKDQQKVN